MKICKKLIKNQKEKTAFSLVELSVVLVIISILVVGTIQVSVTTSRNSKYQITKQRIEAIYQAMGNYLLANAKLPCPASIIALKASDTNYGLAGTTDGDCNDGAGVYLGDSVGNSDHLVYGMVPTKTLGLPSEIGEDGFGNKFTYILAIGFSEDDISSSSTGFGSMSTYTGLISVQESLDGTNYLVNSNDAAFVIISHGANGYGAFGANSSSQSSTSGSSDDEQSNFGSSFTSVGANDTATFYSTDSKFVSRGDSDETFDDILFYKTRNQMVVDFNAHSLIYCADGDAIDVDRCDGTNDECSFPQTAYGQIAISDDSCTSSYDSTVVKPTRRCGAFGVWEDYFINPCTE